MNSRRKIVLITGAESGIGKSTIKLWKSITTHEDKKWTKKYHHPDPKKKSFGAKVDVTLNNGKKISEELERAD